MTDFGHVGIIGKGFCVDKWGVGPFILYANGKKYRFEDSDMFGPVVIKVNGDPTKNQPGVRSPFWDRYKLWRDQNRPLLADGIYCDIAT